MIGTGYYSSLLSKVSENANALHTSFKNTFAGLRV